MISILSVPFNSYTLHSRTGWVKQRIAVWHHQLSSFSISPCVNTSLSSQEVTCAAYASRADRRGVTEDIVCRAAGAASGHVLTVLLAEVNKHTPKDHLVLVLILGRSRRRHLHSLPPPLLADPHPKFALPTWWFSMITDTISRAPKGIFPVNFITLLLNSKNISYKRIENNK